MKHDPSMAGAVPVGAVAEAPEINALIVGCFRIWFDGPEGPMQVDDILRTRLGPQTAERCLPLMETVFRLLVTHGRRPLVRHRPGCSCLGADEAALSHFVAVAATGEREDAMLIASLLVEGPALLTLTEAAHHLGLHMQRALLRHRPMDLPDRARFH